METCIRHKLVRAVKVALGQTAPQPGDKYSHTALLAIITWNGSAITLIEDRRTRLNQLSLISKAISVDSHGATISGQLQAQGGAITGIGISNPVVVKVDDARYDSFLLNSDGHLMHRKQS